MGLTYTRRMNKEKLKRISLTAFLISAIGYLGFISQKSECTNNVKVTELVSVCNTPRGVLLSWKNGETEIISPQYACTAQGVYLGKHVWMYKMEGGVFKITWIDLDTHKKHGESYYVSQETGNRC